MTPQVLKNMKKKHPEAEDVDGYEDLTEGGRKGEGESFKCADEHNRYAR